MIRICARDSKLSKCQMREFLQEGENLFKGISIETIFCRTKGDKDLKTSLRGLEKTDFFTKELDDLLLEKKADIALHSAKDLPDPLPKGLMVAALSKGVDPRDSLVMREGERLHTLKKGAKIATSSLRREELLLTYRSDLTFTDIRGNIDQRLQVLDQKKVDGVVIAEAALIRLGYKMRNRLVLEGETAPYQGRLAALCRVDDERCKTLLQKMDTRNSLRHVLSLGISFPELSVLDFCDHHPLIEIVYRKKPLAPYLDWADTVLFTSKHAAFAIEDSSLFQREKTWIAIGSSTKKALEEKGVKDVILPPFATQEGVVSLLKTLNPKKIFWPRSSISRDVIEGYLKEQSIDYTAPFVYDTVYKKPHKELDLKRYDRIFFSSPSVVRAYSLAFGQKIDPALFDPIGPVTASSLDDLKGVFPPELKLNGRT